VDAWKIFKKDPFDARLGTHKIHRLSAHYGRTIYSGELFLVEPFEHRATFLRESKIQRADVSPGVKTENYNDDDLRDRRGCSPGSESWR
jgi:hypothetical protein